MYQQQVDYLTSPRYDRRLFIVSLCTHTTAPRSISNTTASKCYI